MSTPHTPSRTHFPSFFQFCSPSQKIVKKKNALLVLFWQTTTAAHPIKYTHPLHTLTPSHAPSPYARPGPRRFRLCGGESPRRCRCRRHQDATQEGDNGEERRGGKEGGGARPDRDARGSSSVRKSRTRRGHLSHQTRVVWGVGKNTDTNPSVASATWCR